MVDAIRCGLGVSTTSAPPRSLSSQPRSPIGQSGHSASLGAATLQRARLDDHLVPTTLPAEVLHRSHIGIVCAAPTNPPHVVAQVYWKLMQTPPHVGFLARHQSEGGVAAAAKQCAEDILAAEPARSLLSAAEAHLRFATRWASRMR